MGVIKRAERTARDEGPACPSCFVPLFNVYRELRFAVDRSGDVNTLYPRNQLSYRDVDAYKRVTQHDLTIHEVELIMGIDAIFEGRENG